MSRKAKTEELLERVREIKKEVNIPFEKIAPKIGISIFTLSRWLNRGLPKRLGSAAILLTTFIEKYDEAKKSGNLDEFFPFP